MLKYFLLIGFVAHQSLAVVLVGFIYKKEIHGKVIGITDGDTIKLLTEDKTLIKIRVANIDCPENKQPFASKAKQFTLNQVFSKDVTLHYLKKDRYGRYICNVIYNDSLSLSEELLKNGFAWHYIKYSNDRRLQALEDQARKLKIGLWQDSNPIPPWEWRSKKRN